MQSHASALVSCEEDPEVYQGNYWHWAGIVDDRRSTEGFHLLWTKSDLLYARKLNNQRYLVQAQKQNTSR